MEAVPLLDTCNGCGKRLSIEHALSCPKGGLYLVWHNDTAKELGALGSRALVPSAITYEPKINSSTIQGERPGAGARQDSGTAYGGKDTVGEAQRDSGTTVNGAAVLARRLGQVQLPA